MSISFSKPRAQVFFENRFDMPRDKELFTRYALSKKDSVELRELLADDAKDFLYNGIISLAESIDAICHQRFSWSTVKAYYSVYYFLRSRLAAHGITIIWCKRIYRIISDEAQSPIPGNKSLSSTHAGTIMHYEEVFKETDKLLSNSINNSTAYQWMKEAREITNYKSVAFLEPSYLDIWRLFANLSISELSHIILELQQENYIKCFQEEYAILGIPLKSLQQTLREFELQCIATPLLSRERLTYLETITNQDLINHIIPKMSSTSDTQ